MRTIRELVQADNEGEKLTGKELEYLKRYKKMKKVRHSQSFVYHSRKLPEEKDEQAN